MDKERRKKIRELVDQIIDLIDEDKAIINVSSEKIAKKTIDLLELELDQHYSRLNNFGY